MKRKSFAHIKTTLRKMYNFRIKSKMCKWSIRLQLLTNEITYSIHMLIIIVMMLHGDIP